MKALNYIVVLIKQLYITIEFFRFLRLKRNRRLISVTKNFQYLLYKQGVLVRKIHQ